MKHYVGIISILIFVLCISCENIENSNEETNGTVIAVKDSTATKDVELRGSKWKLVGMVDSETDIITELEPINCKDCYTFTFFKDRQGNGKSTVSRVSIDLSEKEVPVIYVYNDAEEIGDGDLYSQVLTVVSSYSCDGEKLKLFYNNKQNYLLYERTNKNVSYAKVKYNETVTIPNADNMAISFADVDEKRCNEWSCQFFFWTQAEVSLLINHPENNNVEIGLIIPALIMNDADFYPIDTLGYRFSLSSLLPHPTVETNRPDKEDYIAEIKIEEL